MNTAPAFLTPHHNLWVVAASLLLATLASYVALDLSRRVRHASGRPHLLWWGIGSLAMGTGIWSMHFVGMLGFSLPIALGFSGAMTLTSWVAGVAASGIALWVASEANYSLRRIAIASLAMATGICGMHYIGMAALDMSPPIVWHVPTVWLSLLIGLGASAAALFIFKYLGDVNNTHRVAYQLLAAVIMGIAICGMHYTAMAAANFPADSVCLSADALYGTELTAIVVLASGLLLLGTLFTSILESRLQLVARRLSRSLEETNAELTQANRELQKRAFTDALTGLPNRILFEDRLRHALLRMERANQLQVEERIAVLFVDLDGFKPINDSFGHAAGDQILRAAAERLAQTTRESDTVARIGGDEFLLLLEGVRDRAECAQAANRVLRALSEPFSVLGKRLQIACSIGIVLHPEQGDADKLVANADAAMYEAKRAGGGNYVMFESHMGADAARQLQLQSDLRRAVELKQFELYYQPKINGVGHAISGVEALVRWNHPQQGLIGPNDFIGLAERFGLIVRLGDWILDEACRQIAQWKAQGTCMSVAVNLSVMQLREIDFVARVEQALARHEVPASLLLCEITESVAMEDIKATQRTFEGLARVGVFLSIDDFGTGYSSLSHLRKLPARQVKIDRSFVQDLQTKDDARAVVDAVIRLAHALGLNVVAEGVENEAQRDILLAMGCDELQGFLFSRPLPPSDLLAWHLQREGTSSI
ncbi:bifunctional diguanylate cyclase/phosphodiesterase [Variovorax sp. KBW07]|uniref:putative bifunctional diguanylate cyclase/phosphodiesterase n=1 Tax=Variovorax sp. KBW07 TaxID=2153358 RepID=UPI000F564A99|nr:EAL domain-containing protein [Variovorax sp. KBW07]RQO42974.1 bifunctional diguanylate cyclase/phosphodiesterase [Variovorax sp. KBW07]